MQIFDIHAHIYPPEISLKATENIRNFYQIGNAHMTGTSQMLVERGTKAGVTRYLVLPVAIRPDRVQHINDFIVEEVNANDAFVGFGTVHAAMEGMVEEVERFAALGLRGIKMHPDCQRFHIDDPRLFSMYETARGKLPVLLHMGDSRFDYSHPARLRHVLELFPGLQVIAAHFGGYTMYETACELLKDTDCVFDISSSLMFLAPAEAERYVSIYGAERLAFGTDYPLWDPVIEAERFLDLKLTMTQKEQIAYRTACRVLNLPEG